MKLKVLLNLMAEMSWYLDHKFGCEVDQTDFCTCGMSELKKRAKKVYDECNLKN